MRVSVSVLVLCCEWVRMSGWSVWVCVDLFDVNGGVLGCYSVCKE